jgi:hypothetical protein
LLACGGDPGEDPALIGGGSGGDAGAAGTGGGAGGNGGTAPIGGGAGGTFPIEGGAGGSGGSVSYVEQNLIEFRVEPADVVLNVQLGQAEELEYRAYGRYADDPDTEVELTERTVFYVPDNYLVAGFPADGSSTLTTRLPVDAEDAQQRGGTLTVRAQAANTDGTVSTATTSLSVVLTGAIVPAADAPEASPAIPENPQQHFVGDVEPTLAPELVYPNDGVLLPPNLGQLEVHFRPGGTANELYQVQFESQRSTLTYYTRCYADSDEFEPGSCALTISGSDFENLASSNQGLGPVTLRVRGSDEAGHFGASDSFQIEFAEERIDGAVYYWTTSNDSSIMRFDFGSGQSVPEVFVQPGSAKEGNTDCVGCHALSRQGDKAFFSIGNSSRGELLYMNDLSRSVDDADFFTYNGAELDLPLDVADRQNRVLTGSFSPDGDQFVAVAPTNDPEADQKLWFHSGVTGEREDSVQFTSFIPGQPDWSPLGDKIAVTAIGRNSATISFLEAGISLLEKHDGAWDAANPVEVVPAVSGKNRFNPTFFPDASVLLYSEVDQASYAGGSYANACTGANIGTDGRFCNGYSDPAAKTWAVAPTAGATPVLLAHAAAPGVADTLYDRPQTGVSQGDLMDTYPKAAPFIISHRGKNLGWFTVGSQRRAGLRKYFPHGSVVGDPASQALLWMFALDAAAVAGGTDGSYPGFFLPFQDLTTSNHMAQWTQRIVSDAPPPAAPTPPPPAPPPAPPPPPPILR